MSGKDAPAVRTLALDEIIVDATIQQRANGLSFAIVNEYTLDYESGAEFPPVDVFESSEGIYLADGFHRFEAHQSLGSESIECTVHKGTKTDAIVFACAANSANGLRRTNDDKRKAVRTLLELFPKRSDRWIAEKAGIGTHHTVADVRREVGEKPNSQKGGTRPAAAPDDEPEDDTEQTVIGKDGKTYPAKQKPKHPRFPAWDSFSRYMTFLIGIEDGLLATYDRSVEKMVASREWNPECNQVALNYLDEGIKAFQRLRKEIAKHV